jgi:drug/metabolite transporter (DMT)-like permease
MTNWIEINKKGSEAQPASLSGGWKVTLAFAAIYFIWGSTYLAALVGLQGFPPFMLTGIRFLLAGSLLLTWCWMRKEPIPGFQSIAKNSLSGILMLAGGTGSVIWAEQHISSGLAAILIATEPFWFIALDRQLWRTYFSNKWILIGLGLGLAGFLVLFCWPNEAEAAASNQLDMVGVLAVLFGAVSWVIGSLYTKYRATVDSTWVNSSFQLLAAGIFCLLLSMFFQEWNGFSFAAISVKAWLALVYMALMGSIVAYTAYIWLLTVRPPAVVGTHTYVNPLVAVVLGWVFAGEPVLMSQIISLVAILGGVLLVSIPKYQKEVR